MTAALRTPHPEIDAKGYGNVHRWEHYGIGRAPFRFAGVTEQVYSAAPGHSQPGGSCAICGQGIRYVALFIDADSKRITTGLDCAEKSGDAGIIRVAKTEAAKIRAAKARAAKRRREDRERERCQIVFGLVDALPSLRALLASEPHSRGFTDRATGRPLTRLDECDWYRRHAGHAGRVAECAAIERRMMRAGRR